MTNRQVFVFLGEINQASRGRRWATRILDRPTSPRAAGVASMNAVRSRGRQQWVGWADVVEGSARWQWALRRCQRMGRKTWSTAGLASSWAPSTPDFGSRLAPRLETRTTRRHATVTARCRLSQLVRARVRGKKGEAALRDGGRPDREEALAGRAQRRARLPRAGSGNHRECCWKRRRRRRRGRRDGEARRPGRVPDLPALRPPPPRPRHHHRVPPHL